LARKILLADDSVTAQNMGRRILADAGYDVTTVNNGSAALKKIAESKPDLIVLDVYMPGYGGLEVCQRLRESDDTARIPVLLTVGKLEPFKVEEVRRVRADAFIVKPFEASELLTALTKLEDKIVPVAQPRKPGRIPKPGATVDEFMGAAREYGDTETGWKSRLRIPPPHRKSQPEFPEPEPDRSRDVQSRREPNQEHRQPEPAAKEVQAKEAASAEVAAKAVPNSTVGLPSDITAEEIAAIQAAAAAFSMPAQAVAHPTPELDDSRKTPRESSPEKPVAEPEPAMQPASESQPEAAASVLPEPVSAQPAAEPGAPVETAAISQTDRSDLSPAFTETAAVPESSTVAPEKSIPEQSKLAEHEVAAVLASLEFVNGTATDSQPDEPFFATIAVAPTREEPAGPRWVATSVPLTEEESSLVLEEEMQKALAAMAELSAAEAPSAPTVSAVASESVQPPVESASDIPETTSQEPTPAPVATLVEQAPASSEPVVREGQAAYAAAASSGSAVSETTTSIEAVASAPTTEPTPSVEVAPPQPDSELASAWATWKQIRESVVSPQITSQVAEAAASALSTESAPTEPAPAEAISTESTAPEVNAEETQNATATGEDSEAIANIVDSVLSELKPKLMKEIAKKMGKPKKRQ
jgi:twitching motility two-component system response regulator PilH